MHSIDCRIIYLFLLATKRKQWHYEYLYHYVLISFIMLIVNPSESNQKMQVSKASVHLQKLKVHYFFIRGKCQPIRNLLYYLQVDFQDIMHEKSSEIQVEVGFNMGLPMLEDGDLKIHDAVAIMMYICRKYENYSLIGFTPQTIARVQEILMKYSMQRNKIFGIIFESLRMLAKNDKDANPELAFRKLLGQCKFVDFCLKSVAKSKKFVLQTLTLVDFVFYQTCFYICGFYQDYIINHPYYKHFLTFKKYFQKLDLFAKNKNRIEEKYLFLEFNNEKMNSQIEAAWKGPKSNLIKRYVAEL